MKLDNKGMTLMELLISIVLVGMVLVFLLELIVDLKNETDNNNYAFNNQVNRTEAIQTIQKDLEKNTLLNIEDSSSSDNIVIKFHYQSGTGSKEATLSTSKKTVLDNNQNVDKYYLHYTNYTGEKYTWEMKGAKIDPCGSFSYFIDNQSQHYYFKLNIYIYTDHENNSQNKNNAVDDIEITYANDKNDLNLTLASYLMNSTNNYSNKKIGNCAK